MGIDLPLLWAVIILFAVMMYVVMDGFDLGIGLLFPFFEAKDDRDVMMNTVAPVWDGNETWLVLGGAGLLAAFPLAYAVVLSALYLPLILMLIGLIFRGVAFEFRFKANADRRGWWDLAFIGGSALATFCQGVVLGAFIAGIPVRDGRYAGEAFDWLSAFSVLTGVGLLATYALLGSTWLVMKTDGLLHARMKRLARRLAWVLLLFIGIVSLWTPLAHERIAERWFSWPNLAWFLPVPLLVALTMLLLSRSLRGRQDMAPFVYTLILVFLGYSGLGISLWPNIIPPAVSIYEAAGPQQSLGFALVGALLIIPMILMYTAWGYWAFAARFAAGTGTTDGNALGCAAAALASPCGVAWRTVDCGCRRHKPRGSTVARADARGRPFVVDRPCNRGARSTPWSRPVGGRAAHRKTTRVSTTRPR